jgi:hypothetical protein
MRVQQNRGLVTERSGTPGRAKPGESNALAEGILPDQGVCLEL